MQGTAPGYMKGSTLKMNTAAPKGAPTADKELKSGCLPFFHMRYPGLFWDYESNIFNEPARARQGEALGFRNLIPRISFRPFPDCSGNCLHIRIKTRRITKTTIPGPSCNTFLNTCHRPGYTHIIPEKNDFHSFLAF